MTALSDKERVAWLRLARTPNVGPATFAQLIQRFGAASIALSELPALVRRGGGEIGRIPADTDAAKEIDALTKSGGRLMLSADPDYPRGLATLETPPPVISVLGNASLLGREMIAIVGARNASALGRKLASLLADDLAKAGLVVVSGMARGIDAAAHEGALSGGTVAVLAGGVDHIYPPENAKLYERLKCEGAVVSEMPLGQIPQARHFPRRNRIISGLSRGVVVVEAAEGSGSLITANFALEQNREVFAVPGSPLDPRAKGTNRLIREGAQLTESAEDVLAQLKPILGRAFAEPEGRSFAGNVAQEETDRARNAVMEALGPAPVEIDELVRRTGQSAATILAVLLELELAGRVERHPGNRVSWA